MATLRKIANSRYWIVQIKINGRIIARSTRESDRAKAMKASERIERQVRLLFEQPNVAARVSQARIAEVARMESDVSRRQAERVETCLWNFEKWAGDLPLDRVTHRLVEDYQRARLREVAKDTVNKELTVIIRMMKQNGICITKPKAKPGKVTEQRAFNRKELREFFHCCPEDQRALFLLMLCSGARPAELVPSSRSSHLALLKSEMNYDECIVTIRSAKAQHDRGGIIRRIQIQSDLLDLVKRFAESHHLKSVFKPLPNLARHFDRIIASAGVDKKDELGRKLTAHSFRHTFATIMAESVGHNPFVVKQILGHSQITTTDRYCHPTAKVQVIDLAELLGSGVSLGVSGESEKLSEAS